MTILILESVPLSLRGQLTRWMIEVKAGVFCQRRFAFDPPTAGMELTHPDGMTASVTNRVSIGVRLHLRSGCGWGAKDPGAFLFP